MKENVGEGEGVNRQVTERSKRSNYVEPRVLRSGHVRSGARDRGRKEGKVRERRETWREGN